MHAIRRNDPERGRRLQNTIFGYENVQKLYRGELQGLRDTLLMQRGERAEITFVADNPGKWLLHCHMLEHSASGMMTWFEVG